MMLGERDEFPHEPPSPVPGRWQENFFIIAHADSGDATFLIHCKRWPSQGELVARIAVTSGDLVVSRVVRHPIPSDAFRVDGLAVDVLEPYRSLRIGGSFHGTAGFGPLGLIALAGNGTVRADVDLTIRSTLPPADFAAAFDMLASTVAKDSGRAAKAFEHRQTHYEQGGTCSGTITIDGVARRLDGLYVRDHTWGERDESVMSAEGYGFWTATALNGGDIFLNAIGMVTSAGVRGVGVVVDASGQHNTADIAVTFEPHHDLLGFDRTRVQIGGARPIDVRGVCALHLVKYLPGSGPGRFDDNGIARVTGDGLAGFGVHEYAGTLNDAQRAIVGQYEIDNAAMIS